MTHPHATPAVISKDAFHGEPAKFQPVSVNNPDQEEYYSARGYKTTEASDPGAYVIAMTKSVSSNHEHHEYPKWITDSKGESRIVHSADEESKEIGKPVVDPITSDHRAGNRGGVEITDRQAQIKQARIANMAKARAARVAKRQAA